MAEIANSNGKMVEIGLTNRFGTNVLEKNTQLYAHAAFFKFITPAKQC